MEAVEKQALATLLDQVCLLGVLWHLDLFDYGKLLVGEGFDDFETLSTMARQDLKSLKLKRDDARKLDMFLTTCRNLPHVLPLDSDRPLATWGHVQCEAFDTLMVNLRSTLPTGNMHNARLRLPPAVSALNELASFFRLQSGAKPSKFRPRNVSGALADLPRCKSIVEKARKAAVTWVEMTCRISKQRTGPPLVTGNDIALSTGGFAKYQAREASTEISDSIKNNPEDTRNTVNNSGHSNASPLEFRQDTKAWPSVPLVDTRHPNSPTTHTTVLSPSSSGSVAIVTSPYEASHGGLSRYSSAAPSPLTTEDCCPASYNFDSPVSAVQTPLSGTFPNQQSQGFFPSWPTPNTNTSGSGSHQPWLQSAQTYIHDPSLQSYYFNGAADTLTTASFWGSSEHAHAYSSAPYDPTRPPYVSSTSFVVKTP